MPPRSAPDTHVNPRVHSAPTMSSAYALKPDDYFSHARTDIEPLLPAHSPRVLEVGCGEGGTLAWLKAAGRCDSAWGVELVERAAVAARAHADHVETGDAERMLDRLAPGAPFDLVLCLDVLEHMVDPWTFVRGLADHVRPGGTVIATVPNLRHYRVSLPLLFLGRFRYADAGVLDRTHLRFFTGESARRIFEGTAFELREFRRSRPPLLSSSGLLNLLTLGMLRDIFCVQYLLAAVRRPQ